MMKKLLLGSLLVSSAALAVGPEAAHQLQYHLTK